MGKKEEIEERKKKEKIRQLRKGPDLDQFLEGREYWIKGITNVIISQHRNIIFQHNRGAVWIIVLLRVLSESRRL
ncbi:MAG: hypothetical protein J6Q02_07280, partial [Lachnospiraceae bacterium]|nr:hypothetical protein [Lachnospiraceae bacterium]